MEKSKALEILIQNSQILTQEDKKKLSSSIPRLSKDEVYNLGRFLALEKENSIKTNTVLVQQLEKLLQELEEK